MNIKTTPRVLTWRDCEPSRWRGFLFTLRKRPGLALRWVFKRYVCRPSRRLFLLARHSLVPRLRWAVKWVSECVSPALRRAHVQRAFARVELARSFDRSYGHARVARMSRGGAA